MTRTSSWRLEKPEDIDKVLSQLRKALTAELEENDIEAVIDSGCHAGFGNYGPQKGDGIPMTTHEGQIVRTAKEIAEVFLKAAG